MSNKLDDQLKHYGVMGMKWGVRKDRPSGVSKESQERPMESKTTFKERKDSLKRERQWKKVLDKADTMSDEQIRSVSRRIDLENDFKNLSKKSKMAKDQDRKDYVRRDRLSDKDLDEKVQRLRAKDLLSKRVSDASKEQREFGERVMNTGGSLALKYTTKGGKLDAKDIFDSVVAPDKKATENLKKHMSDEAVRRIVESLSKH